MGMEPVRALRDIFAGLAEQTTGTEDAGSSTLDPQSLLAEYQDLPDDLLVTAIGSYADTAPAEVAEHLAPFIAEPGAHPADGLDLLTSAPTGAWDEEVDLSAHGADDASDAHRSDDLPAELDLGDLGSADDLDLSETRPDHGFADDFGQNAHAHPDDGEPDSGVLDLESEAQTEISIEANRGDEVTDGSNGDYLDQIADRPTDQPLDVDDLDNLPGFDEFDV